MALLRVLLAFMAIGGYFSSSNQVEAKSLSDLPPELYQPIFEQLRMSDLLKVMEADDGLARTAILALRKIISQTRVKLNGDHGFFFEHSPNVVQEGLGQIDIQKYDFALKYLTMFGDSLTSLDIDFHSMQTYQINGINAIIAEKCAPHLKHFGIRFSGQESYCPLIRSIFPKAESVALSGGDLGKLNINLNVVFPQMRTLRLLRNFFPAQFIDHHFPNLQEISIIFFSGSDEPIIQNMLEKNPQITTLTAGSFSRNFLGVVQALLPNLQNLEILSLPTEHPVVNFETVKRFSLNANSIPNVANIPFSFSNQLEEVQFKWDFNQLSLVWAQFFHNYENIKKFDIEYFGHASQYMAFLENLQLPNLKELSMQGIDLSTSNFMENTVFFNKLEEFDNLETVNIRGVLRNQSDVLNIVLTSKWKLYRITNFNSDELVDIKIIKV